MWTVSVSGSVWRHDQRSFERGRSVVNRFDVELVAGMVGWWLIGTLAVLVVGLDR